MRNYIQEYTHLSDENLFAAPERLRLTGDDSVGAHAGNRLVLAAHATSEPGAKADIVDRFLAMDSDTAPLHGCGLVGVVGYRASSTLRLASTEARATEFLLFVGLPIAITFMVQLTAYSLSRSFLGARWKTRDLMRLALWSSISPVAAEMVAAVGFTDLFSRQWLGLLWLVLAVALVAMGTVCLRRAQGLRFRKVKSGELYKRTLYWARQMRIPVKEVLIVPPGPGQLTNAYSLGTGRIAMTENYSKFLSGAQLDAVIGHELGHAKRRHGRKELAAMAGVYGILVAACVFLPHSLFPARPLVDVGIVFAPVLINRFVSRRFEFEADRDAVALTRNPQVAILALENLYRFAAVPESASWVTELFATHPSLVHRTEAIRRNAASQYSVAVS